MGDRFVIERLVGAGGMGEVFRATDRLTGSPVALKIVYGSLARDANRFKREAMLLAEVSHPRIVRYVAHGLSEGGRPYLAMEWLDGEDLADRLDRQGLSVEATLSLARSVAEGLAVLHQRGIVHRDVKPSNVFLVERAVEQAKLVDLGVARLLGASRATTRSGVMVGTPGYMAPEQARGEREVDARADVFSLGCVIYECLAGRPAFVGENVAGLLAKILLASPPPLAELGVDVPPALEEVVRRMLSKRAAARPANGAAVLEELAVFSDLRAAGTQRSSAPVMRAITGGERRVVSIVMAAPRDEGDVGGFDETVSLAVGSAFDPRAVAAEFGAEAEVLADGSLVVTLSGNGGATEQAAHAARCALGLRSHLLGEAHVVLATGFATVGDRSPVGEVIERAAAILAAARRRPSREDKTETKSGGAPVFLDETTANLLDTRFDVVSDARGPFIRGLRERDSQPRTLLGKPTPFVGRDRELATVLGLFAECVEESVARVLLVTGAAGAGKSRLLAESLGKIRDQAEVLTARGDALSEGSPFALVSQLLHRAIGISGGEPLAVKQQKLRARVARNLSESEVARVSEFLGEIVRVPFDDGASVQLRAARHDPILMGDQMRRAFCDFVVAESRVAPVVAVLEDLHWGDLPSVKLLDAALKEAADCSILVVALARPEVHEAFPRLWAERNPQEIRVGPLLRRAGERLIRNVLGEDLDPEVVARLIERSAGNAFFLEELIRAHAHASSGGAALPTTVLAMIEARLGRLDAMARRVLRGASVYGEVFWRGGVLALMGGEYKANAVDVWLDELVRQEIVQQRERSSFPEEREYAFRHALVRDAAYQMLTPEDRELGHRLGAEWLERAGEHDPMLLGEHFERGASLERASVFYGRAAFQALEGNDLVAAKVAAERAVRSGARGTEYGELQLLLAEASRWLAEHEAARGHAHSALEALPPDSDGWHGAAAEAIEAAVTLGNVEEARMVARRVLDVSNDVAMSAARVIAISRIAIALDGAGVYELAATLLASVERAGDFIARDPAARAFLLSAKVARASWEGDLELAAHLAQEAALCFEILGDARNATRQREAAGKALLELGAYAAAEGVLRETEKTALALGLLTVAGQAKLRLALACMRTGRPAEAIRAAQEVAAACAAQRDRVGEGYARGCLAGVHYFGNDLDVAEAEMLKALPLVEHAAPYRATLLAFLALTLVLKGAPPARYLAIGEDALRALEEAGNMAEVEALVRVAHAEALHASGDHDAARSAIRAARERLLARAAKIKDPDLKRTFLEVVRENRRTLARANEWLGDNGPGPSSWDG